MHVEFLHATIEQAGVESGDNGSGSGGRVGSGSGGVRTMVFGFFLSVSPNLEGAARPVQQQ